MREQKPIRVRADLAIAGAPPAFSAPMHVGRPNIADPEGYLDMVRGMLETNFLTNNGPLVQAFEQRLAETLGVEHVVVMCNATIAMEIAVRALGLTGDVIVPSYTFIATAHSVYWQGVTPLFADIDPKTHCLDPAAVEQMITSRTSGIIGVHLWGRTADVEALQEIADRRGLKLMFDAAHAFGVTRGGRRVGSFGACEVFSFHATKFLNSLEGGALATNDSELADAARMMRNFGFVGYDKVIFPGTNGKMVEACAAMGLSNLAKLDELMAVNRRNHQLYADGLSGVAGVKLLDYPADETNNYQYVVIEVGDASHASRDELVEALHAENVLARKYIWPGCHKMKPYADLYPWADAHLPVTNAVAARVVVLPTGVAASAEDIAQICAIIRVLCG
jgi:dTDP-4-amino-4,6-dideoxygalactose transaminase